jgi:hypothetical protein
MELTEINWRSLQQGETYIHYNGYQADPGPHKVTITSIWNLDSYSFIYTNLSTYYVSDERTALTVNNTFYKYIEGEHIAPKNLGDAGIAYIRRMLDAHRKQEDPILMLPQPLMGKDSG